MNHKFIYSFIDELKDEKHESKRHKGKNMLSITQMTDDAMSHTSKQSSAKSDRSF